MDLDELKAKIAAKKTPEMSELDKILQEFLKHEPVEEKLCKHCKKPFPKHLIDGNGGECGACSELPYSQDIRRRR